MINCYYYRCVRLLLNILLFFVIKHRKKIFFQTKSIYYNFRSITIYFFPFHFKTKFIFSFFCFVLFPNDIFISSYEEDMLISTKKNVGINNRMMLKMFYESTDSCCYRFFLFPFVVVVDDDDAGCCFFWMKISLLHYTLLLFPASIHTHTHI